MEKVIQSYADLPIHREIADIIRRHSENNEAVLDVVNRLLEKEEYNSILDLGCGYGWLEEGLKRTAQYVHGIDYHPENREAFCKNAGGIAETVTFDAIKLPAPLPFPDETFDLVVSIYSLYFFPDIVDEVKRVLKKDGIFLVITHSEAMLGESEQYFKFDNLRRIIESFSAENGKEKLRKHFGRVECVDYRNGLLFMAGSDRDLEKYIEFKREFIAKDVDPQEVKRKMFEELHQKGYVRLNKDDRIFVARK